jgi:hypothetical protein
MTRQTNLGTLRPAFDAPHDVRPIVEAPANVTNIYTRWRPAGAPWYEATELIQALQEHRGVRLLMEHHVIWLAKVSDRLDDVIVVMPRSSPLRRKGERTL